jgi:hypothetical protein
MLQQVEWVTIKEALAILKISSRTTLDSYLLKFNVRKAKPKGRVYINLKDLMGIIEKNSVIMGV